MRPPRRDTIAQGTKCFRFAARSWKVRGSWSMQQRSKLSGLVSVLAMCPVYSPNRPTPVSLRFPPGRPCERWLSIWRRIPSNWMTISKIWLSARCLLLGPARLGKSRDGDHVVSGAAGARSFSLSRGGLPAWRTLVRYQCRSVIALPWGGSPNGATPADAPSFAGSCQRQTQVLDFPVRCMISTVPTRSADRSTIRARQTCFCGAFRSPTIALS